MGEVCAAGANFWSHIGDETSKTELIFYIIKASMRFPEVLHKCSVFGGQTGPSMPWRGGLKCPLDPPVLTFDEKKHLQGFRIGSEGPCHV